MPEESVGINFIKLKDIRQQYMAMGTFVYVIVGLFGKMYQSLAAIRT